ncbi:MAG: arginase family protein [Candidatus Micrarchaeia archaeon]
MRKFLWAAAKSLEAADYVVFGVPDESASFARRRGVARAPDAIRAASNERDAVAGVGGPSFLTTGAPLEPARIFDAGNIPKTRAADFVAALVEKKKKFILLGGDHSISFEALKGASAVKRLSFVYLDAHPDFICSRGHYYGSVVCDAAGLAHLRLHSSVEIGVRAPEPEELANLRRARVKTFPALAVQRFGIGRVLAKALELVSGPVYLSIDFDVLDPAFAPGVSTPAPGGISALELFKAVHDFAQHRVLGIDLMEVCPPFDFQQHTSHIAARAAMEWISLLEAW